MVRKHFAPVWEFILWGPQISLWTKSKCAFDEIELEGKGKQVCLVDGQTSQTCLLSKFIFGVDLD